jgi:hypothetical protein
VGQAASEPIEPVAMQIAGKFKRIVTGDWLSVNSAGAYPTSRRTPDEAYLQRGKISGLSSVLVKTEPRPIAFHNPV